MTTARRRWQATNPFAYYSYDYSLMTVLAYAFAITTVFLQRVFNPQL